jgi:hypothetical protein
LKNHLHPRLTRIARRRGRNSKTVVVWLKRAAIKKRAKR